MKMKRFFYFPFTGAVLVATLTGSLQSAVVKVEKVTPQGWVLKVDNVPYFVKGVVYQPDRIGESPDDGTLHDWMQVDVLHDAPHQAYVDLNKNNLKDFNEPTLGDLRLMAQMGVNTI